MVLIILEHLLVQVQALAAQHVVLVVGVEEVVDLLKVVDATLDKLGTVLRDDSVVLGTLDDQQTSFEVLCFIEQAVILVTLGVLLRGVHIALTVHNFIPLPVDDRAAGAAHLEDLGVSQFHRNGHKTAEALAFYAHTVLIHIGQAL